MDIAEKKDYLADIAKHMNRLGVTPAEVFAYFMHEEAVETCNDINKDEPKTEDHITPEGRLEYIMTCDAEIVQGYVAEPVYEAMKSLGYV